MPKFLPDQTVEDVKKLKPCEGMAIDLKECLLESDCCRIHRLTPRECLHIKEGSQVPLPTQCYKLRTAFFECKRSLLDMRTRFRGRKDY